LERTTETPLTSRERAQVHRTPSTALPTGQTCYMEKTLETPSNSRKSGHMETARIFFDPKRGDVDRTPENIPTSSRELITLMLIIPLCVMFICEE
jgi:hypothetical protein